jgi:hypothetical protein
MTLHIDPPAVWIILALALFWLMAKIIASA